MYVGVPVMAGPGDETEARGRDHYLRASHADRERTIQMLKAAFVQGRLTKGEFDARVGVTFGSRTYGELDAVGADLPAGPPTAQPPIPVQAQGWLTMKRAIICSACMVIPTAAATATDWVVDAHVATAAGFLACLAFVAATIAAGTLISEAWDKNKRSPGPLPPRPVSGARGQASQYTGTGTAALDEPDRIRSERPSATEARRRRSPALSPNCL